MVASVSLCTHTVSPMALIVIFLCVCVYSGSPGVRTVAGIWQVWSLADAGGLSLPAGVSVEVCIR